MDYREIRAEPNRNGITYQNLLPSRIERCDVGIYCNSENVCGRLNFAVFAVWFHPQKFAKCISLYSQPFIRGWGEWNETVLKAYQLFSTNWKKDFSVSANVIHFVLAKTRKLSKKLRFPQKNAAQTCSVLWDGRFYHEVKSWSDLGVEMNFRRCCIYVFWNLISSQHANELAVTS